MNQVHDDWAIEYAYSTCDNYDQKKNVLMISYQNQLTTLILHMAQMKML